GAGAPMGGGLGQPMMMMPATQLPEANYSIWNVLSLMLVLALMSVTGMMMVDLIRNMWQWDESMEANRPLMEYVLSLLGDK
ncbi:MAG: hypothetical protein KDA41_12930, partial [Planctomycetales bacterium]|nr:hypothetical protein [Planctomycetales bacterium]